MGVVGGVSEVGVGEMGGGGIEVSRGVVCEMMGGPHTANTHTPPCPTHPPLNPAFAWMRKSGLGAPLRSTMHLLPKPLHCSTIQQYDKQYTKQYSRKGQGWLSDTQRAGKQAPSR